MTAEPHAGALASAAEATIIALACKGDQSCFAELVRRKQSGLRNLMRRLCRDYALADDLTQEAFLTAWRRLDQLRYAGAFSAWLRQIAVTTWLQYVRRAAEFAEIELADEPLHSPNTSAQIDLDTALARLPPPVRVCIVLNYHEGLSHSEIAAITQLPPGTVKSHIARGTSKLQILLAAYQTTALESYS